MFTCCKDVFFCLNEYIYVFYFYYVEKLDRTQQDGGHDDAVSCQMSSDGEDDGKSRSLYLKESDLMGWSRGVTLILSQVTS